MKTRLAFSPNVIVRPLYQEVVLPNLCYIGGGGEIAYWLELKSYFEKVAVTLSNIIIEEFRTNCLRKTTKKINVPKNFTSRAIFKTAGFAIKKSILKILISILILILKLNGLQEQFLPN